MFSGMNEDNRRRFAQGAANISLAMPLAAILLAGLWRACGISGNKALLGLAFIACIALGTILAIVSLCNVADGSGSLTRRGVIALIFNGLFVALFAAAIIGGLNPRIKARQAERELLRAVQTTGGHKPKSFDKTSVITNSDAVDEARVREQMQKAATDFKGNDKLLATAWAAYLQEVVSVSKKWQALFQELAGAKVLDFAEVNGRQELRDRQALVLRYKASSDAMRYLVVNSADFFRDQLNRAGATPGQREEDVKLLQAQLAKQAPVLLQIRDLDTRISDNMLGILSLLETNWGSWTCPAGNVTFQNLRTMQTYNALLSDFRTAREEQATAQKQLATLR